MKRQNRFFLVLLSVISSAAAQAEPTVEPGVDPGLSGHGVSMFGSAAIADEQLDQLRGQKTVFNSNEVDGQLHNNEAVSNVTGGNFVTDGAFAGLSGFSTVIQNSGNNVLIQNATVLNLQFQ